MAGRLVVIPAGLIVPIRGLSFGARARALGRPLGRRIPCHCLSVPAVRLIAALGAPVDLYRALMCRHRCQSSINTVTHGRAQELTGGPFNERTGVASIRSNHTPGP